MKQYIGLFMATLSILVGSCASQNTFTEEEKTLILSQDTTHLLRVLQIDNHEDSLFLKRTALPVGSTVFASPEYQYLKKRMYLTVNDPEKKGVGLAAPQIGLQRAIILLQRLDKVAEPFEFYLNPRIIYLSSDTIGVEEGCLSLLNTKPCYVPRAKQIIVEYNSDKNFSLQRDTVTGMTSIIFQHEIDHLNGVLYIDHLK